MDELDAIEKKALEQAVASDDLEVRRKAKLPRLSAKSARIPQPKGWHWNREATAHLGASIRIGAQQAHLLSLVLGDGMKLVLIGLSIGLVASLALTRFVASVLYGVSSTDPATFFTVALLFVCIALAACWIPAHRATRVDPIIALRCD